MLPPVDIAANAARILQQIAESASRAGRDPASVRLVAVTKTFPPEKIQQAYGCGLRDFGENRVQEFCQKLPHLNLPGATFHLIGHLQSNKVQQAMAFDWIQTLDSERLALRLQQAAASADKKIPVLIEVKLSAEAAKTGALESDVPRLASLVASLDRLELRGLMTIPPYTPDPEESRPYFRRLRELRDRWQEAGCAPLRELSMGMSHDFPIAIEEGATLVRIGTAIFGSRNSPAAQ
ncbi:MAG: YggS family pyridoxal phosphate enzyme [Acidobacteria bacterium RIFCSPLOWO2_12_FULL_59_11]|nr:MAG: YggS family pyridoxal phosphate enzyme [Acidobacteria bacterium RIFCSPLOWO2_12_FULL_59_11]